MRAKPATVSKFKRGGVPYRWQQTFRRGISRVCGIASRVANFKSFGRWDELVGLRRL